MPSVPHSESARDAAEVMLRPLEEKDLDEAYLAWFRDDQVTEFLDARNISREDALEHLKAGGGGSAYYIYAIVEPESGIHIGNVKIGPIDHRHGFADCVTIIGRTEFWGKGLATAAIRKAIRIAFDELGLRKLSAGIVDGNAGSLSAYTKAGFEVEGRLKGQYLVDGVPRDRIEIGCFNPKYFVKEGTRTRSTDR